MMLTRNGTPNLIETTMQTIHWDCAESYVLLLLLLGWPVHTNTIHRSTVFLFGLLRFVIFILLSSSSLIWSCAYSLAHYSVAHIRLHFSDYESNWHYTSHKSLCVSVCLYCVLILLKCFSFSFLFSILAAIVFFGTIICYILHRNIRSIASHDIAHTCCAEVVCSLEFGMQSELVISEQEWMKSITHTECIPTNWNAWKWLNRHFF